MIISMLLYRDAYIYRDYFRYIYICRCRCLKYVGMHSTTCTREIKPTQVKVQSLFSNSSIISGPPHPPLCSHSPPHCKQKCFCCPGHGDQRHWRSCWDATDTIRNSAKSGAGFLDLGLLPDMAVAPFQSYINGIPQQNERTLQEVNKYCMTLQVYALLAFQICSGDLAEMFCQTVAREYYIIVRKSEIWAL